MAGQDDDDPGRSSPPADRPGLPDPRDVVSEKTVTSPKGKKFRIIETTEKDEYDPPEPAKEGESPGSTSRSTPH